MVCAWSWGCSVSNDKSIGVKKIDGRRAFTAPSVGKVIQVLKSKIFASFRPLQRILGNRPNRSDHGGPWFEDVVHRYIDFSVRRPFTPPAREKLERDAAHYSGSDNDAFRTAAIFGDVYICQQCPSSDLAPKNAEPNPSIS